ncbi:MAG TPA: hypothetical protein VN828_01105 [Acidobacteriaceae bacterium]|nr:hypothetical protein [Acidobacteriaceae bacterium]
MNAYCVILRFPLVEETRPRAKRCYLSAATAERAIVAASEDNPGWRPIGIEPGGMFHAFGHAA